MSCCFPVLKSLFMFIISLFERQGHRDRQQRELPSADRLIWYSQQLVGQGQSKAGSRKSVQALHVRDRNLTTGTVAAASSQNLHLQQVRIRSWLQIQQSEVGCRYYNLTTRPNICPCLTFDNAKN